MLWDDTFVRYYEPHVGQAAVRVLEAAGFEVVLPKLRKCCGRPAFSQGNLDEAAQLGRHNLALLNSDKSNMPIIFLEPSCYSMFAQDYRELKLPDAERVAARCFLFEQFIENMLEREPNALIFNDKPARMMIHVHCHAKSLANTDYMYQLATRLPQRDGDDARSGLLRHGGRVRHAGIEIQTFGESRGAAHSGNPEPAFRDHLRGVGNELPPANQAPGRRPVAAHGRSAGRGVDLTNSLRVNILQRCGAVR